MKKTAVDWLAEKVFGEFLTDIPKELHEQAKAMERQQIIDAHFVGSDYESDLSAEEYFTETYGEGK